MRIRTKFLVTLLPLTLIPLLAISLIAYFQIVSSFETVELERIEQGTKQSRRQINTMMELKLQKISSIAGDELVVRLLDEESSAPLTENADRKINETLESETYFRGIVVFDKKGELVRQYWNTKNPVVSNGQLKKAFDRIITYSMNQSPVFDDRSGAKVFLASTKVIRNGIQGVVIAVVDARFLFSVIDPVARDGNTVLVVDRSGTVVIQSDGGGVGDLSVELKESSLRTKAGISDGARNATVVKGKKFLFTKRPLWSIDSPQRVELQPEDRWDLIVLEPLRSPPGLFAFQVAFGLLTLAVSAIVVWLAIVASGQITRPIALISKATARIARGESHESLPESGDHEVAELSRAVSRMKSDLDSYQKTLIESTRLSAMGEMTSEISHEIQNKISGVSIWLQHLDSEIESDDERQEYVDEMKLALREFLSMLSSLKSFYKRPELKLEPVDLAELVDEVVFEHRKIAEEKTVRIEVKGESSLLVEADAEKLKGVLINLVLNSIEASQGDGLVRVSLTKQRSGSRVCVEDDGRGISEKNREKVFEPFYTTKSTGSGLGLAISRNTIVAHGGSIELTESDLGGAKFCIELPNG